MLRFLSLILSLINPQINSIYVQTSQKEIEDSEEELCEFERTDSPDCPVFNILHVLISQKN